MQLLHGTSDYEILSELSIAFFEDTGWYKANYTALSDLNQNSLQWGKGTHSSSPCKFSQRISIVLQIKAVHL